MAKGSVGGCHRRYLLTQEWLSAVLRSLLLLFCCYLTGVPFAAAQDLSGRWVGKATQQGVAGDFYYELDLQQTGDAVAGTAYSRTADGRYEARFTVGGKFSAGELNLQEVSQLSPAQPRWCLKYAQLRLTASADSARLAGGWTARNCAPGTIALARPIAAVEEIPFSRIGRWSGHLSQSDRSYGFFYEVELAEDGSGTSHIVSEDNGGEATHQLRWRQEGNRLLIEEAYVSEKTDPKWPWCIKTLQLTLARQGDVYQLTGPWRGYIENTDKGDNCAPGTIYLEKPVLTQIVLDSMARQIDPYQQQSQRTVKVDRVIRVQAEKIYVQVWDNGAVDGDVITLFLNGERILHNQRVGKRKLVIPARVHAGENMLILHAEDLGAIVPNTVAVAIDDGVREQTIILSSNLSESGAILIQPFSLQN